MQKKDLVNLFDAEMRANGFIKKSMSWYHDESRIISLVNLQKSNYGNLYYVNLCTYFKALENQALTNPNVVDCHIFTRMDGVNNNHKDFDYLFNLDECELSLEEFKKQMRMCVQHNILPQLELLKTKEGIMNICKSTPGFINSIPMRVKAFLDIRDC